VGGDDYVTTLSERERRLRAQYRDASVLHTRIQIYKLFSTNPESWHRWAFGQLRLAPESRVLELGCGRGDLWLENRDRIPDGWEVTLSDFSQGMLRDAQAYLGALAGRFVFAVVDARDIPFGAGSFDAVIANHMLYHIKPGRGQALSEIARVLKPGGRLYASTNGRSKRGSPGELNARFNPHAGKRRQATTSDGMPATFHLENGGDQLAPWFADVTVRRYENELLVTEAAPLIANVQTRGKLDEEQMVAFAEYVEAEIARHGAIRLTKDVGLFEACTPLKFS
jgi:ubiquinone/menaquinone biosynthesis C-methylase UbiE